MHELETIPELQDELENARRKWRNGTFAVFGNRETPSDWQPLIDAVAVHFGESPGMAMDRLSGIRLGA